MTIDSHSAQINVRTNTHNAFINVGSDISGYVARLAFLVDSNCGHFLLAHHKDNPRFEVCLLMAPSAEWEQDILTAGYEIIQRITTLPAGKDGAA